MKLERNSYYKDGKLWRCSSQIPLHDVKFNLRKNSVNENINVPIQILYFITFYYFTDNFYIERAFNECNNNANLYDGKTISANM